MAQHFNGEAFWLCGKYYQRRGRRLHRVVWEFHNGPVPAGFHVHHKDGDRANNDISNLELLPASEHLRHHQSTPEAREYQKMHIERIRPAAAEWHGSDKGRDWHSERGKLNGKLPPRFPFVCEECGKQGLAKVRTKRMCGQACWQKHFRRENPDYYKNLKKSRRL